jgi:4-hydroxy-tetrahydrodipicolinate reductase
VRAANGALVHAPNFSIGVNLFLALAEAAGRVMHHAPEFDPHIVETHHAAKKDAPSGTAIALERSVRGTLGRSVDITSVRTGHVPGTHELSFDGAFEQIRLSHMARDRRVFRGRCAAGGGVVRGRRGVFTMRDVLGLGTEAGLMPRVLTGCGTALATPIHRERRSRRGGAASLRRVADRGRRPLSRSVRVHR